jgi:uncharacterized damage-inducible protein DinB
MTDLRYPVGKCTFVRDITPEQRLTLIREIAATPQALRAATRGLSDAQLDTPYRPEGWTVRQVVHHVPDSHMNAYIRFKLALTEEVPTIKPYMENLWAELPDSSLPIETSLAMLEALHERWVALLRSLTPAQWERQFLHPESGQQRLDQVLAMYAWHGPHHTAQVTKLREREGWG